MPRSMFSHKARLAQAVTRHMQLQVIIVGVVAFLMIPIGYWLGFPIKDSLLMSSFLAFFGLIAVAVSTHRLIKRVFGWWKLPVGDLASNVAGAIMRWVYSETDDPLVTLLSGIVSVLSRTM